MFKKVLSMLLVLTSLMAFAMTAQAGDDSGRTLTVYVNMTTDGDKLPDNKMVQEWIEEQLGFKLNPVYTPSANYGDKMNVMLVSGADFDAFSPYKDRTVHQMADDGLILPLNDLLEEHGQNILRLMSEGLPKGTDKNGGIYAIQKRVSNHNGATPTIRVDWVEKAGLDALPTTIEEYEQYLDYVLNNDVNENGDPTDEIPLVPLGQGQLVNQFGGIFLGEDIGGTQYLDTDGKIRMREAHPNYIDYLDKMREWYEKGYIYNEFFVIASPQLQDLVAADRVGGTAVWYSRFVLPFEPVHSADESKMYALLPNLESPLEGVVSSYSAGNEYQNVLCVYKDSENADLLVKFCDWVLSDPTNQVTIKHGLEGVHWNWVDKENLIFEAVEGAEQRYYLGLALDFVPEPKDEFVMALPTTYVTKVYADLLEQMNDPARSYVPPVDEYVPYSKLGTDLEFMNNDAKTLFEENEIKYIIGEIDRDTMLSAIADYQEMYGNILTEVYTAQYNEYMGIE